MKGKNFFFLLLLVLLFKGGHAQTSKGQHVLTAGEGFSLTGLAFRVTKDVINTQDANIVLNSTPVLIASYDFALDDIVSLGISYSYQNFKINYDKFTQSPGVVISGKFTDQAIRENIALRPLVHLIDGNKVDGYIGLRVGYSRCTFRSATDQNYSAQKFFGNAGTCQGLFGIRYFPSRYFGLNAEVAVGPSYVGMFGLNLRFGRKKQ